jgi:hypothetical protein
VAYQTEIPARPTPQVTLSRVWVCRCTVCGRQVRGQPSQVAPDQAGATAHRLGSAFEVDELDHNAGENKHAPSRSQRPATSTRQYAQRPRPLEGVYDDTKRAKRRAIRWIMATRIMASLVWVTYSSSLERRRERPGHAKVRSVCQPQYCHPDIFCDGRAASSSSSHEIRR